MHTVHLAATPETIVWGSLPHAGTPPVLTLESGDAVRIDTVSHEGLVEDQGRDPRLYFTRLGIDDSDILPDAIAIAGSGLEHDFDRDGPHILNGPIAVNGALPGDVLRVEVLALEPRVLYGIISNRHGKGCLAGEFPEETKRHPDANVTFPELYGNVSLLARIEQRGTRRVGVLRDGDREIIFPLRLFLGTMGVAHSGAEKWNSVPPARIGGNIDIKELGVGSTLYIPVEAEGGLFFTGDPHFAMGDGEVALSALEGSLAATLRLTVLKSASSALPVSGEDDAFTLFGETEEYWIIPGLDPDLDEAMKIAVRRAVRFLAVETGIARKTALAYLSAAADFHISQVVDRTKGVHALVRKTDFADFMTFVLCFDKQAIPLAVLDGALYVSADALPFSLPVSETKTGCVVYPTAEGVIELPLPPRMHGGVMHIPVCALSAMGWVVNWSTRGDVVVGTATPTR